MTRVKVHPGPHRSETYVALKSGAPFLRRPTLHAEPRIAAESLNQVTEDGI